MDGYVFGFVAVMTFMILVTVGALIFISMEPAANGPQDKRVPFYTTIRRVDTNTIETVDATGEVQRWQRSA